MSAARLVNLAAATGVPSLVFTALSILPTAAASEAILRVKTLVGSVAWSKAMQHPSGTTARALALIDGAVSERTRRASNENALLREYASRLPPRDTGLAVRAAASGMTIEERRAAETNVARASIGASAHVLAVVGEAGLAERAARSGMTVEERRRAEENVSRGMTTDR